MGHLTKGPVRQGKPATAEGKRFYSLLKERGLTARGLAADLGMSRAGVSLWMLHGVSARRSEAVARRLRCEPHEIEKDPTRRPKKKEMRPNARTREGQAFVDALHSKSCVTPESITTALRIKRKNIGQWYKYGVPFCHAPAVAAMLGCRPEDISKQLAYHYKEPDEGERNAQGKALERVLVERNISIQQFSSLLGVTRRTVTEWLTVGVRRASQAQAVADTLQCDISEIAAPGKMPSLPATAAGRRFAQLFQQHHRSSPRSLRAALPFPASNAMLVGWASKGVRWCHVQSVAEVLGCDPAEIARPDKASTRKTAAGIAFRELCFRCGFKPAELAARLGLSVTLVYRWFIEGAPPERAGPVLDVLGCDLSEMMSALNPQSPWFGWFMADVAGRQAGFVGSPPGGAPGGAPGEAASITKA